MEEPREAVSFLTRSPTRVGVLRALADGPQDRRDLQAATAGSRSTLSRALAALEEQGWISYESGTYTTTTAGDILIDRLLSLLETVTALRTLEDGLECLPIEAMDIDIRHFADARPIRPTELAPTAPYDHGVGCLESADRFRAVARFVPQVYVRAFHEAVMSGRLEGTCVLAGTYLDRLPADGEIRAMWEEVAAGPATVRRYDGSLPYVVHRLDEMVHIWLCHPDGDTWGLLESENAVVRTWAEGIIDDYLAAGEPLAATPETER